MRRITCLLAWTLLLTACASSPKKELGKLKEGMDKDDVLSIAGNPKRTFRSEGQDHWIYVYFEDEQEWHRQLDFHDGKVTRVGLPVTKENWVNQLEGTGSMEEYEQKVRDHRSNTP